MPRMHILTPDSQVESLEVSAAPENDAISNQHLGGDFVQAVKVLYGGASRWMLIGERSGAAEPPLQPNARATAIYWTAACQGRTVTQFDPLHARVIHGTAILFEGVEP